MFSPTVKEFDVIFIGQGARPAVICSAHNIEKNICEVVYLDRGRAITEDVHWNGNTWEFSNPSPCGGYADNIPRLAPYVSQLKMRSLGKG